MKFTVATNFQPDFIKKINKKEVYEIFGKLTADYVGGGRASYVLPSISKQLVQQHIKEAHANGIQFNYLLNAACLGNREFTLQGQRKIRQLLDWLEKTGVDSLTVALPLLLELVKKRYPRFKTHISVYARINTLGIAKYWEDLGADLINLEPLRLNRNFEMLRKIRKNIKCSLQLVANNSCLCFCPFAGYHSVINSHASQSHDSCAGFIMDYCVLSCKYTRLKDPVNFIRSDWIRPEDIHYYEEVGIDSLKIVERTRLTESVALAVNAYTKRRYDGNLADLIPSYQAKSFLRGGKKIMLALKYLMRPFSINYLLLKKLSGIPPGLDVYIDNRALDGFLEFFVQDKCIGQGACNECGYCSRAAKKAVKIDEAYRQNMLKKYEEVLGDIIGG